MNIKDDWHHIRCFGSTVVGPRGQVVIPAHARKELGIDSGATLLAFDFFQGQALLLLKVEAVERMLGIMSERLTNLEKLVKDYGSLEAASGKKGG